MAIRQDSDSAADAAREKGPIRVAAVQYDLRRVASVDDFQQQVRYFVSIAADYGADFVTLPEMFTLQLLSMEPESVPLDQSIDYLTRHTKGIRTFLRDLAVSLDINIIGGSHLTRTEAGRVENICYVCLRDGSVHERAKIHPTPNERRTWKVEGGDSAPVIHTDCGPIGVMICYDSEFPELARHLVDQDARILFVPFCTDDRQGFLRVRYSCHARAVENQCYVVMAGNCGNLPNVENADIQYAQSCVLTPCDHGFARDGIAADATPNSEMMIFADLDPTALERARAGGTVQNLNDRRPDLYHVEWTDR